MRLNRTKLYIEFKKSPHTEILGFYKDYVRKKMKATDSYKGAIPENIKSVPGNWYLKTKKRANNKERVMQGIEEEADKQIKKKVGASLKIDIEKLLESKKNLFKMMQDKIDALTKQAECMRPQDLKIFVELIKTELGEPTTISKNENKNENTEEVITPEKKALVEKLKKMTRDG